MRKLLHPYAIFAASLALLGAAGCRNTASFTGIEHQNLNLEGSQVSWVPHTALRGQFGLTFTKWDAEPVTNGVKVEEPDGQVRTYPIEPTQNPTPLTVNHIHGPTNPIALGHRYTPKGKKVAY